MADIDLTSSPDAQEAITRIVLNSPHPPAAFHMAISSTLISPEEAAAIVPRLLEGFSYPARQTWRTRPQWSVEEATLLAVDIDPYFLAPACRLHSGAEQAIRPYLDIISSELTARVGAHGTPEAYYRAWSDLDITHPWCKQPIADTQDLPEKNVGEKERTNLHTVIGAMLQLLLDVQGPNNRPRYPDQTFVIAELEGKFPGKRGISQSNLEHLFPKAKRALTGA